MKDTRYKKVVTEVTFTVTPIELANLLNSVAASFDDATEGTPHYEQLKRLREDLLVIQRRVENPDY